MGTNLTDLRLPRKVTVRELGGCMGPIWPSYYGECSALLVSGGTGTPTGGRAGTPSRATAPRGGPGRGGGDAGAGRGGYPAAGGRRRPPLRCEGSGPSALPWL